MCLYTVKTSTIISTLFKFNCYKTSYTRPVIQDQLFSFYKPLPSINIATQQIHVQHYITYTLYTCTLLIHVHVHTLHILHINVYIILQCYMYMHSAYVTVLHVHFTNSVVHTDYMYTCIIFTHVFPGKRSQ